MKYVIIGNSTAAVGCIEGIRQVVNIGNITVISDEPHHTYSRPLISYLVKGKVTQEQMKYRPDNFYEENGVNLLTGVTAVKINVKEKTVSLSDGRLVSYDKLLLATGSHALKLPIEGSSFMTLDDALRLKEKLSGDQNILIVGAGLIGLKCAEGILGYAEAANNKPSITVVDLAPRVLASILDEEAAAIVQKRFEDKGVKFMLSTSIDKTDGYDIVVVAAGVRPNTALLSGIANINKGIIINGKCETSVPDIYAAGDCSESIDASSGESKIMALLPNAYMQGECAGINMAGGNCNFNKAIPMNAIGFMGLHIITAGNYIGEVYTGETQDGTYKKLFYSDNKLNGYILMGNIEKAGIYTALIREKTPLDSIDFELICEKPGLMAFTKDVREQKLGGGK